jgi:hypothetical protein
MLQKENKLYRVEMFKKSESKRKIIKTFIKTDL